MKTTLSRTLQRAGSTFADFTTAQKLIAGIGLGALLIAGFLVFRWVAQPSYAPLFTNLAPADASAVVDELETAGTPYELANDGTTVLVPRDDVYRTRITLSGEGLPAGAAEGGYSLLDEQDLSTSQFQEQVDFKRAMEGELASTIMAMDGVTSAVVHLALPEKEVFADEQAPPTASVLIGTDPGDTLDPEQVQAVVHLVAASIDGMDPEKVTVADASGRLLSADDGSGGAFSSSREQYTQKVEQQMRDQVQAMLDRVVGPGNATVSITADVNFDKTTTESRTYTEPEGGGIALATSRDREQYTGMAPGGAGSTGVVGPDGQMDTTAGGAAAGQPGSYDKTQEVSDNAVNTTVEQREVAPGQVTNKNVGVAIDSQAAPNTDPAEIERQIEALLGIDRRAGDVLRVSTLPFDRSAEEAAAAALAEQEKSAASAERMGMFRNIALVAGLLLALLLAWLTNRRRNKQRVEATNLVVETLRAEPLRREAEALESPASALLSLEGSSPDDQAREELIALVESQPEDVAKLLRGWLVER